MGTNDLLQESTVYAFHVPSMNAIKVGFGTDGRSRMQNYSRQYALASSAVSLREWKIPSPNLASAIETACHRALLQADFYRVDHVVDEREAKELFDLGRHTYEDAVLLVAEAVEETINSLLAALEKFKPLSQEKARQQKDVAQKRRAVIREEKKAKKEEEKNRFIEAASLDIQQRWKQEVEPFVIACDSAKMLYKQFSNEQGILSTLNYGKLSRAYRMSKWRQWATIKKSIPEIFYAARCAKSFYCEMEKRHGKYADQGLMRLSDTIWSCLKIWPPMRLGTSLWSPGDHELPWANLYSHKNGMAFLEVQSVVATATGFGGDDAAELIRLEPELLAFVKYAEQNPAPEIREHI